MVERGTRPLCSHGAQNVQNGLGLVKSTIDISSMLFIILKCALLASKYKHKKKNPYEVC